MELEQLRSLRPALDKFVAQFDDCIKTRPSREHLRTCVNGQLGPLERKSIEPIALEAKVPPRSLQEFLSIHRWDEAAVGRRLRGLVRRDHAEANAIGVIDETSFAKKGAKTAGVQPQHCGATGKTENCVATVHLGYVAGDFQTLLDGDLYLPEKSWAEDRVRCRAAGIPEAVCYRPKWQIALDLLERALGEGVALKWVTADEDYGRVSAFRDKVAQKELHYVVEVPPSITGWTRRPKVEPAGTVTPAGRRLTQPRLARKQRQPRPLLGLLPPGGPAWQAYHIKDTDKGAVVWKVRETRFYSHREGLPGPRERLLVAREALTGEVKCFLSNAPPEVPLKNLLCVAFSRCSIERLFEDGKGEVGLDHFEVRCYRSLMRHLVLTTLSLYFLSEQVQRLGGKKGWVDALPSKGRGGGAVGSGHAARGTNPRAARCGAEDRLLAGERRQGRALPCQDQTLLVA